LVLSVPEASYSLGISSSKLWAMVAAGEIPSFSVGARQTRIQVEDIAAYIERQKERK